MAATSRTTGERPRPRGGYLRPLLGGLASGRLRQVRVDGIAALRARLPASVVDFLADRCLVCRYSADRMAFFVTEGSRVESLGTIAADAEADATTPREELRDRIGQYRPHCDHDVLELNAATLVRLPVILPPAAESNLAQVLAFEMNRLTPFQAEQVYYDYGIRRRDADAGKLHVDLYFIPRERLDRILEECARLQLEPDQICRLEATGESVPTAMLARGRTSRPAFRRWIDPVLFGTSLLLLIALLVLPSVMQRHALNELETELASLREEARRVAKLREEVQLRADVPRMLVRSQLERRSMIELLAELSDTIPEHTWLRGVRIDGNRVTLDGESARATSLPALIEQSPLFVDVGFDAPVTSSPRSERDAFAISAAIAPLDQT